MLRRTPHTITEARRRERPVIEKDDVAPEESPGSATEAHQAERDVRAAEER